MAQSARRAAAVQRVPQISRTHTADTTHTPHTTHTPQTLLAHVRALTPALAPAEQRVAAAVARDPAGAAAMTISELSAQCRTSETTVIRFCRAIGFSGYPELRLALAAAAQAAVPAGWQNVGSDIGPDDTAEEIIKKIVYADARAVEETAAQLDAGTLAAVVDAVLGARHIDVYGVGASALVALDLQQKLHRVGHAVFAWQDPHIAITSASLLRRGDVAIGISHTGATADTIESLAEARRRRAVTVAITNFPGSPISRAADHVLTTAARETTFRSGAMASRIAALTVVDSLFVAVAQRDYSHTLRALERTYTAVNSRR
ncbi:MAG TPA: MurR/RpiR family transcriptional regulator [Streptosporangiaceae bacterium]|nr:MurR/RpiR family transcriptional regulator [Streptosporangiaceae bacterium]